MDEHTKAPVLNERLTKQLIRRYQSQVRSGIKPAVVLHALLHEVYAQGQAEATARAWRDFSGTPAEQVREAAEHQHKEST